MEQLAALGLAIFYLAVVAAGACSSALRLLLWLFGEAPDEPQGTAHGDVEGVPGATRFGAADVCPTPAVSERSEEEAA